MNIAQLNELFDEFCRVLNENQQKKHYFVRFCMFWELFKQKERCLLNNALCRILETFIVSQLYCQP